MLTKYLPSIGHFGELQLGHFKSNSAILPGFTEPNVFRTMTKVHAFPASFCDRQVGKVDCAGYCIRNMLAANTNLGCQCTLTPRLLLLYNLLWINVSVMNYNPFFT